MSSFLGHTGSNLRAALDYAQHIPSILFLDEFDAIAKSREDAGDVGELKRLVTVLLQAIDSWPAEGLLLAATNHPDLLDRAAWRRFERVVNFDLADASHVRELVKRSWRGEIESRVMNKLATLLAGRSFAEISQLLTVAQRRAPVQRIDPREVLDDLISEMVRNRSRAERFAAAQALTQQRFSQRKVHEMTGVSRDTLRKHFGGGGRGRSK